MVLLLQALIGALFLLVGFTLLASHDPAETIPAGLIAYAVIAQSRTGASAMPTATAGSIMTPDVVTVRPNACIAEAIELLLSEGISGLPVTDEDGRLIG